MKAYSIWLVVLGVALSAIGCTDHPAMHNAGVAILDSAGVRVIENGSTVSIQFDLGISTDPLFRVGWAEDEPSFQWIRSGAIMSDGRFAVSDVNRVHVLSMSGEPLYSIGAAGQGPGEFSYIYSVTSLGGDTLMMHDFDLGRVTTFVGSNLLGTERVVPPIVDHRHIVKGHGPDDVLILVPTGYLRVDGPSDEWLPVAVLRYRSGGGAMDTIARLDFQKRGRSDMFAPVGWSEVSRNHLIHARGDRPEILWYDLEGNLLQIARWDSSLEPTEDFWSWVEEEARKLGRYREMSEAEFREEVAEWKEDASGSVPAYGKLFADAVGNVWLSEWMPFNLTPRRYSLIGRDGVFAGSVDLPPGFEPIAFGENVVLGFELSDLEVPAAVAYRIHREPS